MRRLLRWTFNTLAAASLLLSIATVALWVRSYWVYDQFYAGREEGSGFPHYEYFVVCNRGQFGASFGWSERPEDEPKPPWHFEIEHPTGILAVPHGGFGFSTLRQKYYGSAYNTWTGGVPAWALFAAFAVLPAVVVPWQIRTIRRRRRARLGCCPACGYDLRATPERCPECGRKA